MASSQVIRTKIIPPNTPARVLVRPRITKLLSDAFQYRLTLLQAGAGYGKSTALTSLVSEDHPTIWYQVTQEDVDPLVFLLHLNHATKLAFPDIDGLPIPILESWDASRGPLPSIEIVSSYLNALSEGLIDSALLILDDLHLALMTEEIPQIIDLLLRLAPTNLHLILASRPALNLPNLSRWQLQGQVLSFDQNHLAFTIGEIFELFKDCYQYELSQGEAERLFTATEGWVVALQLIWQSLRSDAAASVDDALNLQPSSLKSLFDVLAKDVFGRQPEDIQEFLSISSILRVMTAETCDQLRGSQDSREMLAYLRRQDLFVVDLDEDHLRYQNIFRKFLHSLISIDQKRAWHMQAAEIFRARQDHESTIYHLFNSEDFSRSAQFLEAYGRLLLNNGRLNTLEKYLETLPPELLHQHPKLLSYLGDLARLHSRYQEALGWYRQVEEIWRERGKRADIGRALRDQARVYLDTVDPAQAEELLQAALRLSDGIDDRETQARLYELLAENKLNAGKLDQAEGLRKDAEKLRLEGPADTQLAFRVLLRTGRLDEARQRLEARLADEKRQPVTLPRAHRETLFLLSLIYSFQGEAESALQTAEEGTRRGVELDSPFMTAVGHMRQGHALMLYPGEDRYNLAVKQFEQAIEISHTLAIPRLRVEANWGLCRAFGYQGEIAKAQQAANSALAIAAQVGDEWIGSLVRLAYGASLTLTGHFERSTDWLLQAGRGFQECSDPFGYTVARLWQCVGWLQQNEDQLLSQVLPELLNACRQKGYDYLFTRPTLLGAADERLLVPLLILARDRNWQGDYGDRLLSDIGLPEISLHPGYQLKVYTLGSFKVTRGEKLIEPKNWRREKTRQLFQLLVTYRDAPLDREQIFEHLWPGSEPQIAKRNFKVVLNTLFNVLEPSRKPGSESAYIIRQGSIYSLRPGADIWLDVAHFLRNLDAAEGLLNRQDPEAIAFLENAIHQYRGEYLPDLRYESWAAIEREQISVQFLRAADRLCDLYLQNDRAEDTIKLAQQILVQDNCWERAYRHLMISYNHLGDQGQMARTYLRCVQTLQDELEVSPSLETEQLYIHLQNKNE